MGEKYYFCCDYKVAFCGNSVQIMAIWTALLWRVNARRPPQLGQCVATH